MGGDTCRSPLFYWDEDDGEEDEDADVIFGWTRMMVTVTKTLMLVLDGKSEQWL